MIAHAPHIVVITQSQEIGCIGSAKVFKITEAKFIPLGEVKNTTEVGGYVEYLEEMLKNGFFYSYDYDLTNSAQQSSKIKSEERLWRDYYDLRYVWNYPGCTELFLQSISPTWITPIIQGFVGIKKIETKMGEGQLILISRRRYAKAGARYLARGVDNEGNVSNFVETEQLLYVKDLISSYVQIRGSIPLFWQQVGVSNELVFTKSAYHSTDSLKLHFENIFDQYGSVVLLNLLNQSKPNERALIDAYEPILKEFQEEIKSLDKFLKYIYFDYHKRCHKHNLDELEKLFNKWRRIINLFGYYQPGKKDGFQNGVFRTNCLDCLDRTNVVQGYLAIWVMKKQLADINTEIDSSIDAQLKSLWADNGDYISIQYSGENSVISEVMRSGEEGFLGKLSHFKCTINRLFKGWLDDDFGQKAIDLFLYGEPFCVEGNKCFYYR